MREYVIYEKWFNGKGLIDTPKDFPTIFGTITRRRRA
jgi:hypothetical protein